MPTWRRFFQCLIPTTLAVAVSAQALGGDGPSAPPPPPSAPVPAQLTPPTPYAPSTYAPSISQAPVPYRSEGPDVIRNLGTPQAVGTSQVPGPVPGIEGVPSPYTSTGIPLPGEPQPPQLPAAPPLPGGGLSGIGTVPSPYGSGVGSPTAAPPLPGAGGAGLLGTAPTSGQGGTPLAMSSVFNMIGDAGPFFVHATASNRPPGTPPPGKPTISPAVRGFKIAENQSPVPQDRVYFFFNYYNDVNDTLNRHFDAPIKDLNIYRYTWGFEKTFNEGLGSFGMRLPLDNVTARPRTSTNPAGLSSTALGNLTLFAKHIFALDPETGSVATGGFAISPRTGPRQFAGAPFLFPTGTTTFQPFFAFLLNWDRLYFQGFSAFDFPADFRQPTMMYNDFGLGYYVYRDLTFQSFVSAVAPTVEVHINTPLNPRGAYDYQDPYGTPNTVDITSGLNFRIRDRSALTMAVISPVTGPKPYHVEAALLLNVYFGRSRGGAALPMIGR